MRKSASTLACVALGLALSMQAATAQQLRLYTNTSLTACPADERLRYFYDAGAGWGDIPQVRAPNWCGAAAAGLAYSSANDPFPERRPYQLEQCVAGDYYHYSHNCGGTNVVHSQQKVSLAA